MAVAPWQAAVNEWLLAAAALLFFSTAQVYTNTEPWVRPQIAAGGVFALWSAAYYLHVISISPQLGVAVVLAFPPLLLGARLPAEPGVRRFLLYFVCIGVGYILIQVALIQKFILFLGHPTYALTVIIFSMLISSGLGSYYSRRLILPGGSNATTRLRAVLIGVAAAVIGPELPAPTRTQPPRCRRRESRPPTSECECH